MRFALTATFAACSFRRTIHRFLRDEAGSYVIVSSLLMPVLIGTTALGTEVGMWLYNRQTLQSAADSAAISGATAHYYGADIQTAAKALAASYGYIDGVNGVSVTIDRPPTSGNYTGNVDAVEVIVSKPQPPLFSVLFHINNFNIVGRAVAMAHIASGCTLSLNKTVSGGTSVQGSAQVNLTGCNMYVNSNHDTSALDVSGTANVHANSVDVVGAISGVDNITVSQDIATDQPPLSDPYADTQVPSYSGCDSHNYTAKSTVTINPGVYCGGMQINAGAVVTLNPGIYYLDQGSLMVNGGGTLTGDGVTLVFTSSTGNNYATATINGGATVNLTPPTDGPTAGITFYGDPNMPTGTTYKFNGGADQYFGGAVYLPKGSVNFAGGSSTKTGCTQIIGDTITFTGDSNLGIDCTNYHVKPVGSAVAKLVE